MSPPRGSPPTQSFSASARLCGWCFASRVVFTHFFFNLPSPVCSCLHPSDSPTVPFWSEQRHSSSWLARVPPRPPLPTLQLKPSKHSTAQRSTVLCVQLPFSAHTCEAPLNLYRGRQGRGSRYSLFIPWWDWDLSPRCSMASLSPPPTSDRQNWSTESRANVAAGFTCARTSTWRYRVRFCWRASTVNWICLSGIVESLTLDIEGFHWPRALYRALQANAWRPLSRNCSSKLAISPCNEGLAALLRTIPGPFPFYSLLIANSLISTADALRIELHWNN